MQRQIEQAVNTRAVPPLRKNPFSPCFALSLLKKRASNSLNSPNRQFVAYGHKLNLPALGGRGCHAHVVRCELL